LQIDWNHADRQFWRRATRLQSSSKISIPYTLYDTSKVSPEEHPLDSWWKPLQQFLLFLYCMSPHCPTPCPPLPVQLGEIKKGLVCTANTVGYKFETLLGMKHTPTGAQIPSAYQSCK
jgi:hypothetical protein